MRRWPEAAETALFTVIRTNPTAPVAALYDELPAWMQEHYNLMAVTNKLSREGLGNATARVSWVAEEGHERDISPFPEPEAPPAYSDFTSDKKIGHFNWRDATKLMRQMQQMQKDASWSQDYSTIRFLEHVTEPICVTSLCDLHMGSWATDYDTLERVSDELLSIPNLYAILIGDEEQMSIKMRNVAEVQDALLTSPLQHAFFESWMDEMQSKILASCWENHATMREEAATGFSYSSEIKKRRVIYHDNIGHTDIQVGSQGYSFAISHVFRGRSMYNPVHGQMRYGRHEGQDREILMAGDSHTPGIMEYWEAGRKRIGINGGTAQVNSGYGKRHFSLKTAAIWPCVVLYPDRHMAVPYWSVAEYLASREGRASHLS